MSKIVSIGAIANALRCFYTRCIQLFSNFHNFDVQKYSKKRRTYKRRMVQTFDWYKRRTNRTNVGLVRTSDLQDKRRTGANEGQVQTRRTGSFMRNDVGLQLRLKKDHGSGRSIKYYSLIVIKIKDNRIKSYPLKEALYKHKPKIS